MPRPSTPGCPSLRWAAPARGAGQPLGGTALPSHGSPRFSPQHSFISPTFHPALIASPGFNQIRGGKPVRIRLRLMIPTRLYSTDLGDTQQYPVPCPEGALVTRSFGSSWPIRASLRPGCPEGRDGRSGADRTPQSPQTVPPRQGTAPGASPGPRARSLPRARFPRVTAPRERPDTSHGTNSAQKGPRTAPGGLLGTPLHTGATPPAARPPRHTRLPRVTGPQPAHTQRPTRDGRSPQTPLTFSRGAGFCTASDRARDSTVLK